MSRAWDSAKRGWSGFVSGLAGGAGMESLEDAAATEAGIPVRAPAYVVPGLGPAAPPTAGFIDPGEARAQAARNFATAAGAVRASNAIPGNPAVEAIGRAPDMAQAFDAFMVDPVGVVGQVGIESAVQFLPALATAIITRKPTPAMAAAGANSGAIEYGSSVLSFLQERGVNTGDPNAVQAALSDRPTALAAMEFAGKRASIIAGVDVATMGLASKAPMLRPFAGKGASELLNAAVVQPT
ncbi:MAG: hypothetical protein KAX77_07115, partial [Xanthomonadales bacterium]|nr:hypothetical protein [Xanthomonadales bacterium]